MSMQDKEIDEIFRSKLGDLEIQPTERVWKGITLELDGNKAKHTLMPVFRIAAAVTIFLAAGLYFLLKDGPAKEAAQTAQDVNARHHAPEIILKNNNEQSSSPVIAEAPSQVTEAPVVAAAPKARLVSQGRKNGTSAHLIGSAGTHSATSDPEIPVDNSQAATPGQPQLLAASGTSVKPVTQAVVPDQQLSIKAADNDQENNIAPVRTNPVTAQVVADASSTKPARKKHGIHSLGDLINVVVAKVDKRDDKLIEFSNTDDDESTITGINLGVVKVKKEK